ncbi:hypothetical protein A0H77_19475 [Vibrio alginolyticus]|uniref:DNA adenine methylase n=1 Tax=Vibrio alginolyticus TaxID=663 RepID=UPI0007917DEF|nr:DNA adenine methylase [Vibrio alginolyticus]KXZ35079.1 hypothetical protein A0H77_19475 [Vibrio alginolyticus]
MKSIGYMGSKEKLLTFIEDAMRDFFGEKYNEINSFFDCFSGSGRVANHFKNQFDVTTNDKQFFTKVINNAFLNNKHSSEYFKPLIDELNNLDEQYFYKTDGWFTQTYSMNHNVNGTLHEDGTRKLFLTKNGRKIDMVRTRIDEMFEAGQIDQEAKDVLIVCLMRAISLVQNAGGHQNSYYSEWKDKAFKDLVLTYPTIEQSVNTHTHFNSDIEDVIADVDSDVIYIDPPYGSTVPYSAYYHLYNTVAENSRPEVSMMASKPVDCYGKSKLEKNKKNEVMKSFIDLISASKSKTVVLSYHNEGLLSHADLVKVMELSGCDISSLKTYGTNHKANLQSLSASKDKSQKLRSVVEYVIIVNKARFSVVRSDEQIKEEIAKHLSLCIESDFEEIAYIYDKQNNSFESPITKKVITTKKTNKLKFQEVHKMKDNKKNHTENVDQALTKITTLLNEEIRSQNPHFKKMKQEDLMFYHNFYTTDLNDCCSAIDQAEILNNKGEIVDFTLGMINKAFSDKNIHLSNYYEMSESVINNFTITETRYAQMIVEMCSNLPFCYDNPRLYTILATIINHHSDSFKGGDIRLVKEATLICLIRMYLSIKNERLKLAS